MPSKMFAGCRFFALWMRWTCTFESADGLLVRAGLWQTLQYGPSTRDPPWNTPPKLASGLKPRWHMLQLSVLTISRLSVTSEPDVGSKLNCLFTAVKVRPLLVLPRSV